jgi:hypothetical protein
MGAAAENRAYRTREGIVGATAANKRHWIGRDGSLSRQATRLPSHNCHHSATRSADDSRSDWTLSHNFCGFRIEISYPSSGHQNLTR